MPHYPPYGPLWGITGGLTNRLRPGGGAFEYLVYKAFTECMSTCTTLLLMRMAVPPNTGGFDVHMHPRGSGNLKNRKSNPLVAPLLPVRGVVGHYIDRRITVSR